MATTRSMPGFAQQVGGQEITPQEPSWRRRPSPWALKTKLWTRFDVEGTVCTASPEGSCDGSPTCVTAEDEGDGDQEEGMGSWPPTASGCP